LTHSAPIPYWCRIRCLITTAFTTATAFPTLGNLVLFGLLSAFSRRKRFDGQVWWWYVLAYGALRFAIEFLRGDYTVHYFGVFTIAHFIAAALMIIAAIGLWGTARWRGATP